MLFNYICVITQNWRCYTSFAAPLLREIVEFAVESQRTELPGMLSDRQQQQEVSFSVCKNHCRGGNCVGRSLLMCVCFDLRRIQ